MATNGGVDPNPDALDPVEPFSKFLQLLRGSVRPLVTLIYVTAQVVAFGYVMFTKDVPQEVLMGLILGVTKGASTVVGVWFGARK